MIEAVLTGAVRGGTSIVFAKGVLVSNIEISGFTVDSVRHDRIPGSDGAAGILSFLSIDALFQRVYSHGNYYGLLVAEDPPVAGTVGLAATRGRLGAQFLENLA